MKKSVKQLCSLLLAVTMVITLVAQPKEAEAKKKYSLSENKIILQVGAAKKLTLKGVKKFHKLTWKSNKKSVAMVSQKGKVKAKKVGKAKITVTIKNKKNKKLGKLTCAVTVKKKEQVAATPMAEPTQNPQPTVTETVQVTTSPAITETPVATSEAPKWTWPPTTEPVSPAVISGNVAKFPCQVKDFRNPEKIIQIEGVAAWGVDTDTEEGEGTVQICASSLEESTEEMETGFVRMHLLDQEENIVKEYEFEVVLDGNPDSNLFNVDFAGVHGEHSLLFPDVIEGTQGDQYVNLWEIQKIDLSRPGHVVRHHFPIEGFYEYDEETKQVTAGYEVVSSDGTCHYTFFSEVYIGLAYPINKSWCMWKGMVEKTDYRLYKRADGSVHYGVVFTFGEEDVEVSDGEVWVNFSIYEMDHDGNHTFVFEDGKGVYSEIQEVVS